MKKYQEFANKELIPIIVGLSALSFISMGVHSLTQSDLALFLLEFFYVCTLTSLGLLGIAHIILGIQKLLEPKEIPEEKKTMPFQHKCNTGTSKESTFKRRFMNYYDGVGEYVEPISPCDTFRLGLCSLEYNPNVNDSGEDGLTVYLRRPGLLIGRAGKDINKAEEHLGFKLAIKEVRL